MRRGILLVAGIVSVWTCLPAPANAGPRSLPGALFGALTRPLGAVLGTARQVVTPPRAVQARQRNVAAARQQRRAAAVAAAAAATGAGAAVAAIGEAEAVPLPVPAPARSAALARPETATEQPAEPSPSTGQAQTQAPGPAGASSRLNAFEDIVGFVLWPDRYGGNLRSGLADIMGAIFAPAAGRTGVNLVRADLVPAGAAGTCNKLDELNPDWPTGQIANAIRPTPEQQKLLERLHIALAEAIVLVKTACRDQAEQTPAERVRLMQSVLWSVRDAALGIRAPLATLLESLSEEQKRPFFILDSSDPQDASRQRAGREALSRLCMARSREMPVRRIEKELQINESQRTSLQGLQRKSFEMGQFLMTSCLQPVPSTPVGRLDMAADRLTAVIFAASNIGLALNDFYDQLGDGQKRKFDTIGL